ncbi:pyridoxal-phosphate dependent enzyme domain-containing protein [Ditylenchus destructor]|uniref:Pyridoxal-phosphate dependent enzyme domain-containing protein n=1 Tax=Ditylenchus destructor TaxID=166010 RepID=A0AAD4R2F0_9BILA|nr:pyridoxal-phosphate dependent enzyme domain-containing protein [Ditylenchus destructor]
MLSFLITVLLLFVGSIVSHPLENFSSQDISKPGPVPNLTSAPVDTLTSEHVNKWRRDAISKLWDERNEMKYTPIIYFDHLKDVTIVFKNESASATSSLKHRFAWALVMWAVLRGHIGKSTTVYEASSGSTAFSEAYMCKLIGVKFATFVPEATDKVKIEHIENMGGNVVKVKDRMQERAKEAAAKDKDGFFIDQFGNADYAEDYHLTDNNGIESINVFYETLTQLQTKPDGDIHGINVDYFVHTAGTGGTLSSVGKYIKRYKVPTQVVLADTEFSLYYDFVLKNRFVGANQSAESQLVPPGIAGTASVAIVPYAVIGKTTSLIPSVIDRVVKVPDLASTAAAHVLLDRYKINAGPSTGVSFLTCLHLIATHRNKAENLHLKDKPLVLATLLSDPGTNYLASYYNITWIEQKFTPHGGLKTFECWKSVVVEYLEAQPKANSTVLESPLVKGARECPAPLAAGKHLFMV